ncbi:MAG: two-component regulator propeller domain-containing protein [Bacteroidota bacterium]
MKKILLLFITLLSLVVLNSCDKEVYTGVTETEYFENGKIFIRSNPTNAKIYLDDKNTGLTTPDSLIWLTTGSHKITLKLTNFKDTTFYLNVIDRQTTNDYVDYYQNPGHFGKLECTSTPENSEIIINDSVTLKTTPYTFTFLRPGYYNVRMKYPIHRDFVKDVLISGGVTTKLNAVLDDTSTWVTYNKDNSPLTSNYVTQIIYDNNNAVWIGTKDKGVVKFQGNTWQIFNSSNSIVPSSSINAMVLDNNNNVWVGFGSGLVAFTNSGIIDYSTRLPSKNVFSLHVDKTGNLWVGTEKGISKFDGISWTNYNTSNSGLGGNYVISISSDANNKLWIGTSSFGISVFDGSSWRIWNMGNMNLTSNLGNSIKSIAVDQFGNVWAAHLENFNQGELGGMSMYDGQSWHGIDIPGISITRIESISIDRFDYIWVCTKNGAARFQDYTNPTLFVTQNSKVASNHIVDAIIDLSEDIYLGTFGAGFSRLKKGN